MAELEKTPTADTSVNKPQSGTYGERAELNRLKQSLPPMSPQPAQGPGAPAGKAPAGMVPPSRAQGRPTGQIPPGIPSAIVHPTDRPDQPLNTPLPQGAQSPMGTATNVAEARIMMLQALSQSKEVSAETREWAKIVLELLTRG